MKHWKMPCTPDVLIIPSKMVTFAKVTLGCLVINPGWISKGTTGGTFASIDIYPMKRERLDALSEGVEIEHGVHERAEVSIKKI